MKGGHVLNGPLLLNEIVSWCKKHKKKCMLLKIHFEKSYDSISWDFLLGIMAFLGFRHIWIGWIKACLVSSRLSIVVDGSPTDEFSLEQDLRQGDPLSPFLFLLVMEALNVAMLGVVDSNMFIPYMIGSHTIQVSYLFYADDVIFMGHWSKKNMKNLI